MSQSISTRSTAPLALAVLALAFALPAAARDNHFKAELTGYEEVPTLSTPGEGRFKARLNKAGTEIEYELRYEGLEGTVTQAHIHLGQRATTGGIVLFLCTNLGNGPAGTPACPAAPGTVTGTLVAAGVVGGATAQGLSAGDFAAVVEALRAGAAYANVHTTAWPSGEIRGQLK
jgi:hypothetical protein